MRDIIVAERYAEALLAVAGDRAGLLAEEMEGCRREDLFVISRFLDHPRVSTEKKTSLIDKMTRDEGASGNVPDGNLLARFLRLLVAKGRARYLWEIFHVYPRLYRQKMGVLAGRVTLARPSDDATRNQIQGRLETLLSRKLDLIWEEDAAILGGFVFSTETLLLDASIKCQLATLGEKIKGASLTAVVA